VDGGVKMIDYKKMEIEIQNKIKTEHKLNIYAWPGGYPLFYITKDGGALCAKCANDNIELLSDPDDPQWYLMGYEVNYENEELICDNCAIKIDSAYGDDDDE
jgi:hypothetical protein